MNHAYFSQDGVTAHNSQCTPRLFVEWIFKKNYKSTENLIGSISASRMKWLGHI